MPNQNSKPCRSSFSRSPHPNPLPAGEGTENAIAAILTVFIVALLLAGPAAAAAPRNTRSLGVVEFDTKSEYSHIRVRHQGTVRSLIFVRDSGEEAVQTMVNIKKPYELLHAYARTMFASYLLVPKQEKVLIVGLGGGAMVHFLKHYDPDVHVDALEIDPAVVKVADRYFDIRSAGNVNIMTDDGIKYLENTDNRYDAIYMDAFLKPSQDTDATGKPLAMKTAQFYKEVQKRLTHEGIVVFNVNPHKALDADLRMIHDAFAQTYVFHTADTNIVVLATMTTAREDAAALRIRAKELDHRFKATFSFQDILKTMSR